MPYRSDVSDFNIDGPAKTPIKAEAITYYFTTDELLKLKSDPAALAACCNGMSPRHSGAFKAAVHAARTDSRPSVASFHHEDSAPRGSALIAARSAARYAAGKVGTTASTAVQTVHVDSKSGGLEATFNAFHARQAARYQGGGK